LPYGSPLRETLEHIEAAARRAADLTTQMLAYAGRASFEVGPVDLAQMIREMGELLRATLTKRATVVYDFALGVSGGGG